MRKTLSLLCAIAFVGGYTAMAQTKISGTEKCSKADTQQALNVGDRADHNFIINQGKCTWTKPINFGVTESKDDVTTAFLETSELGPRNAGTCSTQPPLATSSWSATRGRT